MKLVIFMALLIPLLTKSQEPDSLKKYSYRVSGELYKNLEKGIPDSGTWAGTGFFIRQKESIFFITSKHVFNGCDDSTKHPMPDTMKIWIKNSRKYIPIDNKFIKDTSICSSPRKDADVLAIKIDDKWSADINSVEGFIPKEYDGVLDICTYGYLGGTPNFYNNNLTYMDFHPGEYTFEPVYDPETHKNDSINYYLFSNKLNSIASIHGFSGSPVFLKSAKTKNWMLGGVLLGLGSIADSRNFVFFVKMSNALGRINFLLMNR